MRAAAVYHRHVSTAEPAGSQAVPALPMLAICVLFRCGQFRCSLAVLAFAAATLVGHARAAHVLDLQPCANGQAPVKRSLTGAFRVHAECDRVLLEIPPELFDRDILVYTEFAEVWATDSDIVPGAVADNRMMRWRRYGSVMHLEVMDFQMRPGRAPALERSVQAAQLGYLYRSFPILGEGAGGAPIVDATPLFVADAPAFAFDLKQRFHMVRTDQQRSYVQRVKVFPSNIQVRFFQTWLPDPKQLFRPPSEGQPQIPPSVQFVFTTNMLLLPREPLRGRYWDARVGYFSVPFDDYGGELPWRLPRAFITRYRLEKRDPAASLSEPVRPIVFYLNADIPERWRPYIKRGIEDWQVVFEAAGFRNAIVARDAPTPEQDPDWDPEDARYSVVRWIPSARQKALGPSLVDPRSGEVVSSHLILWHDVVRLVQTWYLTEAGAVDPRAAHLPLPDDLIGELLSYVVKHELGHALGLRHNFKAASAYSVEQLRDPEWTRKLGTTASITSYGRMNYVAQPGDGASLLPRFGPYDFFAVEWGYKPLPGLSPEDEWATLDRMAARQVSEPMLRFGGEDEAASIDPTVTTYVIGSDPIASADLGLRNVDRVMRILLPATTTMGGDYTQLAEAYEVLVMHRYRQLEAVARLVGGVVETRYAAGRGEVPFAPVDPARAQAAVRFLLLRGFNTPMQLLDPNVLLRIVPEGAMDPLQGTNIKLLERLLDPRVFQRMSDATLLAPLATRYLGLDLLRDLNAGLFDELAWAPVKVGVYRRELQRSYVQLLVVGSRSKPEAPPAPERLLGVWSAEPWAEAGSQARGMDSPVSNAMRNLRAVPDRPSEFRAAARTAADELWRRLHEAAQRTEDGVTASHLADLMHTLEQLR